jgi:hypothetical protein
MKKATTVGTLAVTTFRILGGPRARAQDSISQPQVKRQVRVKIKRDCRVLVTDEG